MRSVAFSVDGSRLASAGYDRVVHVWDRDTGEQVKTFRFDSARINAVAFSPDGQFLAAAGSNTAKSGEAVIWKMSYEKEKPVDSILPTLRKAEMSKVDSEVRSQIENAVRSDEMNWQNLAAPQRGIKDRIVKVLTKTLTLDDQQVALAVYLPRMGRLPSDEEAKTAQKKFAETKGRHLRVLQHARGLVQSREFSNGLATTNERLFKIQKELATKRGLLPALLPAGEIPILLTADEFQKLAADCAAAVAQASKTDEQFVDLVCLLAFSRFPSMTEANQLVAHLKKSPNRATATTDIFVFLLNHKEFMDPR